LFAVKNGDKGTAFFLHTQIKLPFWQKKTLGMGIVNDEMVTRQSRLMVKFLKHKIYYE